MKYEKNNASVTMLSSRVHISKNNYYAYNKQSVGAKALTSRSVANNDTFLSKITMNT